MASAMRAEASAARCSSAGRIDQAIGRREQLLDGVITGLAVVAIVLVVVAARRAHPLEDRLYLRLAVGRDHQVVVIPLIGDARLTEQQAQLRPLLGQPLGQLVYGFCLLGRRRLRRPGGLGGLGGRCIVDERRQKDGEDSGLVANLVLERLVRAQCPQQAPGHAAHRGPGVLIGVLVLVDHEHGGGRLGHVGIGVHVRWIVAQPPGRVEQLPQRVVDPLLAVVYTTGPDCRTGAFLGACIQARGRRDQP